MNTNRSFKERPPAKKHPSGEGTNFPKLAPDLVETDTVRFILAQQVAQREIHKMGVIYLNYATPFANVRMQMSPKAIFKESHAKRLVKAPMIPEVKTWCDGVSEAMPLVKEAFAYSSHQGKVIYGKEMDALVKRIMGKSREGCSLKSITHILTNLLSYRQGPT